MANHHRVKGNTRSNRKKVGKISGGGAFRDKWHQDKRGKKNKIRKRNK